MFWQLEGINEEYCYRNKEQLIKSLEQKSLIIFQLNQITESLDLITEKDLLLKNSLKDIKKELEEISAKKNLIGQLKFEFTQLDTTIKNLTIQVLDNFKQRQETFRKKKELFDIKDIDQKYNTFVQKRKELQLLSNEKLSLKEFVLNKIAEERSLIEKLTNDYSKRSEKNKLLDQEYQTNLKNIKQRITEYEIAEKKLLEELFISKNTLDQLTQKLDHKIDSIESLEKQLIKRKSYFHKYSAQINVIENEIINLNKKQELIRADNDPSCPLCDQSITEDHRNQLIYDVQKNLNVLNRKITRHKILISDLKLLISDQENAINLIKKRIDEQKILSIKIDEYKRQIAKIEQDITDQKAKILSYNDESKKLIDAIRLTQAESLNLSKELQITIENNPDLIALKIALSKMNDQLKDIDIKLRDEQNINEEISKIEELKQKHIELINSLALQEERKTTIKRLCNQAQQLKNAKKEKESELARLLPSIQLEQKYIEEENLNNQNLQKILAEKENFVLKKGSLEQQLSVIKQKEDELLEQKKLITEFEQSSDDYKAISIALGKDGIQALLIEDAIPEIEHEANALLTRLTDNQSHLTIESVRDLKTGGTKETLDIKISDPVGIRPYELFSGGEAFRIDFALRIAISKLLARRAGTSLETLIIDEGFGSQDEEALSSIMEVIYKIQNDFAKVIVVSHLSSMKEQFPINFLVHKGPQGSQIKVIDQG